MATLKERTNKQRRHDYATRSQQVLSPPESNRYNNQLADDNKKISIRAVVV